MPEGCSFRFVEEKHASGVVEYMVWSPKMDLIAVANNQGEVKCHSFTFIQVNLDLNYPHSVYYIPI